MAPMGLPERDRPAVPAEFCGATVALGARGRWVRSDQCPDPAPLGAPLDWQWRQWGCRNGTGRRCRRNFVGQRWHWGLGGGGSDLINAPTQLLLGRPLIGNGANGAAGTGQAGGAGGILWGNGGTGGSGAVGPI